MKRNSAQISRARLPNLDRWVGMWGTARQSDAQYVFTRSDRKVTIDVKSSFG
jgi:hypothetical protein